MGMMGQPLLVASLKLPKEDQKKLGQYVQRQILEMMKKNQKLISEV